MTEGLYDRIIKSKNESIKEIFESLNLYGYDYVDQIEFAEKDKIVKYVAYAYSYESELLRQSKDREINKKNIIRQVGLDINTPIVKQILRNEISAFNEYVSWWLIETAHPLFARYISAIDLEQEKLQIIREGLQLSIEGKTLKQIENFAKQVPKDSKLKTQAFFDVVKIREQADKDFRQLQVDYEYLYGIVRDEIPEKFRGTKNMAEFLASENQKKNRKPTNIKQLEKAN